MRMKRETAVGADDGLSPAQRRAIAHVLAGFPQVDSAVLYGSRAMGRQRPGSDVDLALMGEIDLFALNEIGNALDDLLLPYAIDLSVWKDIENAELKDHIERVGKVLYSREGRQAS